MFQVPLIRDKTLLTCLKINTSSKLENGEEMVHIQITYADKNKAFARYQRD